MPQPCFEKNEDQSLQETGISSKGCKKIHTKELMKSRKGNKEATKILAPEYAGSLNKVSKGRESCKGQLGHLLRSSICLMQCAARLRAISLYVSGKYTSAQPDVA